MSRFAESLRRLYIKGRVTRARLEGLAEAGKITDAELEYILGDAGDE